MLEGRKMIDFSLAARLLKIHLPRDSQNVEQAYSQHVAHARTGEDRISFGAGRVRSDGELDP